MIFKLLQRSFVIAIFIIITASYSYSDNKPQRIVSLSPNLTQVIYALGYMDQVVGVTIFDEYPPQVIDLPKVGGWINPNYEAILALKPDLVVLMKDQDISFGEKLRNLGLKTFIAKSNDSIKDIIQAISDLGEILGESEEAKKLTLGIQSDLNEIEQKTKNTKKKSVMIVVGRNPGTLEDIYVIGRNNYIDELITLAGGENVVENERNALKITKEAIFTFNPDIIIEINHQQIDREAEILAIWSTLKQVEAVKNNQVHILSSKVLLHPSQRIVDGAQTLTEILHPKLKEQYGSYN
ncbi:MAG: ABC transporter substrate-binding protein [Thermodesulfobacteriales bacterium]|nr:MAG: ABC transporter substrate-binding protein [Thermodesulfobacteriales bacterium]